MFSKQDILFIGIGFEIKKNTLIGDQVHLKIARKLYQNFLFNFSEK